MDVWHEKNNLLLYGVAVPWGSFFVKKTPLTNWKLKSGIKS